MLPSIENEPGEDWFVVYVDLDRLVPDHLDPHLDNILDLPQRERSARIRSGTPIIVSPSLELDPRLIAYFSVSTVSTQATQTLKSTAEAIKAWMQFLEEDGCDWVDADQRHYWDYRRFRTEAVHHGEGVTVLSQASFQTVHHTALSSLYGWAKGQKWIAESPIPDRVGRTQRAGRAGSTVRARTSERRDRWVTPLTFQLWRDVGLRGRLAVREGRAVRVGPVDPSWRGGRNVDRDTAYVNLMVTTALRSTEQASLLLVEVPQSSAEVRLSGAVAKYGKSRIYTPLPTELDGLRAYLSGERARAVRRAQKAGRYEDEGRRQNLLVVKWDRRRRHLRWESEDGQSGSVHDLDAGQRKRLYTRDSGGLLEPAMVWLQDAGLPMSPDGERKVFERANDRVAAQAATLGLTPEQVPMLSQHSLRFTFALWLLAALHRRIDERLGVDPTHYDERRYEAAFDVVRDMLGHASVTTTKDDYLEPVKGLRRSLLVDSATAVADLSEVIAKLTTNADQVLDAGTVWAVEED